MTFTTEDTWSGEGLLYKTLTVHEYGNDIYQIMASSPTFIYAPEYSEKIEAQSLEEAIFRLQDYDSKMYDEVVAD